MSQKFLAVLTIVSLFVMIFAGCEAEKKETTDSVIKTDQAQQVPVKPVTPPIQTTEKLSEANVGLKFKTGDSATYKSGYKTKQFIKLDMAVKTRVKDQDNFRDVDVIFSQDIQAIKAGNAIAKITVKDIVVLTKNSEDTTYDFDSRRGSDKEKPLYKLIGKSYTISISPDGKVVPVDLKNVASMKLTGTDNAVFKSLFNPKEIVNRHEIHLPKKNASKVTQGKGWSKVVWSHPKIMAKKTFEKAYVLKSVDGNVANVSMSAYETDKPAEGDAPKGGGFGPMSKMFDTQEKYTGQMKFDVASGKVIKWNETCNAIYVITDPSSKSEAGGPASLTMGLIHTIKFEKVD